MKKTVISIILVLTLIFTFAACKGNSEDETTTAPETTTSSAPQDLDALLNELESNLDNIENETAVLQPVEPDTLPEGTEVSVELDSENKPKDSLFLSYFENIAKDDKFTMSALCSSSIDGMGLDIPITMAVSGDKCYVSMKAQISAAMTMDVDFIINGNKGYMVIHNMKAYAQTESGDNTFVDSMIGNDFATMTYTKTTQTTSDGQKYICEEYIGNDGATVKCYFPEGSKKPERIESFAGENVTVMKNITFSSDVDESVFEVPSGYKNMEGLTGLS